MVDRGNLFYKGKKDTYNFRQFYTIRSFAGNSFNNKITLDEADKYRAEVGSYHGF